MRLSITRSLRENIFLKFLSLLLAIGLWFYIVSELDKGGEEEKVAFQKIFPSYETISKNLPIKPILVGKPRRGYRVVEEKIASEPGYCIVVGPRNILKNVRHIFTLPLDVEGASAPFTRAVPIRSIAPGIFVENTLVAVTVPVERS